MGTAAEWREDLNWTATVIANDARDDGITAEQLFQTALAHEARSLRFNAEVYLTAACFREKQAA